MRWGRYPLMVLAFVCAPAFAQGQTVIEYYHRDAVGSARAVTDQNDNVVRRLDYAPCGEEMLPTTLANDPLRFTGKERDAD